MSVADRAEDARILLNHSSYRLGWARKYDPGKDPRVLCELAHDTIELALNIIIIIIIVAAGGKYRSTHDLGMLTKATAAANEPLPRELDSVRQLPRYTGGGRYSFRRPGGQEPISRASYEHILNLAEKTNGWAKDRFRTLTGEEIDGNGEAEKRKEELVSRPSSSMQNSSASSGRKNAPTTVTITSEFCNVFPRRDTRSVRRPQAGRRRRLPGGSLRGKTRGRRRRREEGTRTPAR